LIFFLSYICGAACGSWRAHRLVVSVAGAVVVDLVADEVAAANDLADLVDAVGLNTLGVSFDTSWETGQVVRGGGQ